MTSKRDWEIRPDSAGPDERLFFDADEWRLMDAITARIIPTDHDPGAREANVVRFIDRYLSGIGYIYASADGSGFLAVDGKEAAAWQQRVEACQERYRDGLRTVEDLSRERHGKVFAELADEQQDDVIAALSGFPKPTAVDIRPLVEGEVVPGSGGAPPSNQPIPDDELDFFPMLVLHTRQGFYSDPVYGGNAGHIGWQVVGFPGPASLAVTQRGEFSTLEYMLPDAVWPFSTADATR